MSSENARQTLTYFGRINDVDPVSQCIVFGFIRCIEQSLSKMRSIPMEIFSMCLLYYYNPEYFTNHGDYISLKNGDKTMEHNSDNEYDTVYGNLEINDKDYIKCSWTFQINKLNDNLVMGIGISCNRRVINDMFAGSENTYAYEAYRIGELHSKGDLTEYGCPWKDGDIVKMELDVENKTLRYFVNSEDQGIAVQDINFDNDIKYVMAMYLDEKSIVTLLEFEATYSK